MGDKENTGLTSPHRHIKITTTYGATPAEIDLGASRTALLQSRLQRKIHTGKREEKRSGQDLHP